MSQVRKNLMSKPGYMPYCGALACSVAPRTTFNGKQFECSACGWKSRLEATFIATYRLKWSL